MQGNRSELARAAAMFKSLGHPVRIAALELLSQAEMSPSEIADELGLPIANVSYHAHALVASGCVELTRQEAVRGAIKHVYALTGLGRGALEVAHAVMAREVGDVSSEDASA